MGKLQSPVPIRDIDDQLTLRIEPLREKVIEVHTTRETTDIVV